MSIKKRILIASGLVVLVAALAGGAILVWSGIFSKKPDKEPSKSQTETEDESSDSDGLTDEELQQLDDANKKLNNIRTSDEYINMAPTEQMEVMLDAIEELADNELIKADSILVNEEELYITYEYTSGVLGAETFGTDSELAGGPGYTLIDNSFNDLKDEYILSTTHKGSALIIDLFTDQSNIAQLELADQCREMAEDWSEKGVDTKIDYTATLDELMYLDGNNFVLFMMHGSCFEYKNHGIIQTMTLSQKQNSETDRVYKSTIDKEYILFSNGKYAVTASFFEEAYGTEETKLDGTIFFFNSCQQMGVGEIFSNNWNDICDKIGVSAFVAYHDSLAMKYGVDMAEVFMDQLLADETAFEAFNISVLQNGGSENEWREKLHKEHGDGESATPYLGGDPNAKFKWLRNETPTPSPTSSPTPSSTPAPIGIDINTVRIGDEIRMGNYAGSNIEWIVLDANDKGVLLISKYVLEIMTYNDVKEDVTWETCSLRKWLNEDFYSSSFSDQEKQHILLTNLQNPDNNKAKGGNNTDDYVFLLSIDEAEKYFENDDARRAEPTQHVLDKGYPFLYGEDTYAFWWLRSPGLNNTAAVYVLNSGALSGNGFAVDGGYSPEANCVRPAMWVSYDDISVIAETVVTPIPDKVKEAYLDIVNNVSYEDFKSDAYGVPTSGSFTFDLVYIDDDDIPELLVCLTISGGPNGDEVFANLYAYNDYEDIRFQAVQRWAADRVDASTVYYPRENLIRESIRMNYSTYKTVIANLFKGYETAMITTFDTEYEGDGDSMTSKYYIYESSSQKRASEITEKDFYALTTGKGEAKPLIATMSKELITEYLS